MIAQKLKNFISQYFTIWWIPIVLYLIPFGIYLIADLFKLDLFIDISLAILFLNILGNIIASTVLVSIKKWYFIIPQLGISFFIFLYISILFTFSPPDYYGAHKTIPNNIEISKPLDKNPSKEDFKKYNLVLSSSSQPGIYNYFTNVKPKELGSFYIKAFEITSNDRLSAGRITSRSQIKVQNLNPKIYTEEFTIYEGSWEDKYAARIELWFKPLNRKKDYKITQRNYIVEGWMR